MPEINKIIDKLQKLIKHEESARASGSIAEAEAFASKIQKFLVDNQLSMSDIEIKYEAKSETVSREEIHPRDINIPYVFGNVGWQNTLLRNIALCNNCKTIVSHNSNIQYVVGFNLDRQIVITLYSYFVKLALHLCEGDFVAHKLTDEYPSDKASGQKRAYSFIWKKSWLEGFSISVSNRLYDEYKKATENIKENQEQGLIHLRNKEALVKDYISKNTETKKMSASNNSNNGAYEAGREKGRKVSITGKALE